MSSVNIDLIVIDHHNPDTTLPPAYAIINPKRIDTHKGYEDLCAAGVTFIFLIGLNRELRQRGFFKNKKKGLGSAIEIGIKKSRYQFITIFMCDSSDSIMDLIKYYKIMSQNKYDAVLGSRFIKKSKIKNYPLFKLILKI